MLHRAAITIVLTVIFTCDIFHYRIDVFVNFPHDIYMNYKKYDADTSSIIVQSCIWRCFPKEE